MFNNYNHLTMDLDMHSIALKRTNELHINRDCEKLVRVIHSCKTIEQLDTAEAMLINFERMYEVYMEKTRSAVLRKRLKLAPKPAA